jgi:preprotein translocase subunit SecB
MADDPQTPPGAAPTPPDGGADQQATQPRLMIQTQYVKDLSFENPRAPTSLGAGQARPEISVRVDVRAQPLSAERYEVVLDLNLEAKSGGETAFVLELTYGGVFGLLNIPKDSLQPILLIECPRLLFPFARRIVADVSRDGGFPPLMIDPIDFVAVYRQRQQAQAQTQAAPAASPIAGNGSPDGGQASQT